MIGIDTSAVQKELARIKVWIFISMFFLLVSIIIAGAAVAQSRFYATSAIALAIPSALMMFGSLISIVLLHNSRIKAELKLIELAILKSQNEKE